MDEVNTALIERYQLLYQRDPRSQIFATLGEAYRRMGLLEEGRRVCLAGLKHHPNFAGGRVALARILMDLQEYAKAVPELESATSVSPENILAHTLLAECALKLKQPKQALQSYKMVLLLNPQHDKALKAVKKLESLTADEFDEDAFAMRPLPTGGFTQPDERDAQPAAVEGSKLLDRYLSLADAFLARNDIERSLESLQDAERQLGSHPEIERRMKFLRLRSLEDPVSQVTTPSPAPQSRKQLYRDEKIAYLKQLLRRIGERQHPR